MPQIFGVLNDERHVTSFLFSDELVDQLHVYNKNRSDEVAATGLRQGLVGLWPHSLLNSHLVHVTFLATGFAFQSYRRPTEMQKYSQRIQES